MISIIIPTRNRYDFITDLISDLQNQTVEDIEIIIVDQSLDKESLIGVKHIFDDGTGPCRSRNIGAKEAKGEILVFLDDDARVDSNFIEELTKPIVEGKFSSVSGAVCDPQGNYLYLGKEALEKTEHNFIKLLTQNPDSPHSGITLSFPGGCSAIKKEVFFAIGMFDENFDPTGAGEDREMAINLFKHGYGIWYNAQAKLLHFGAKTGGSREVGNRSVMLEINSLRICKKHFSFELTKTLALSIQRKYYIGFLKSLVTFRLVRTRYLIYRKIKKDIKLVLLE